MLNVRGLAHLDLIDDGRESRGGGQHQHDVEEEEEEEEEEEIKDKYDLLFAEVSKK